MNSYPTVRSARSKPLLCVSLLSATLWLALAAASDTDAAASASKGEDAAVEGISGQGAPTDSQVVFVENVGQFDSRLRFQSLGGGLLLRLTDDGIWITVLGPESEGPRHRRRLAHAGAGGWRRARPGHRELYARRTPVPCL